MTLTMTSREFNQRTHAAKVAAAQGPVVVTDRGRPAHVLLTFEAYQRMSGPQRTLADAFMGPPELADIDLVLERPVDLGREVDLL